VDDRGGVVVVAEVELGSDGKGREDGFGARLCGEEADDGVEPELT
jgi:hypothetical protein